MEGIRLPQHDGECAGYLVASASLSRGGLGVGIKMRATHFGEAVIFVNFQRYVTLPAAQADAELSCRSWPLCAVSARPTAAWSEGISYRECPLNRGIRPR